MIAELKEMFSLDFDLKTYEPIVYNDFCISVRAMIGPKNDQGADSFDITVCTPIWLNRACEDEGMQFGRHMLIVQSFDFDEIERKISKYCSSCSGETWINVAEKLSRIGSWEYEDYYT